MLRVAVHHHAVHLALELVLLVVVKGDVVFRQTGLAGAVLQQQDAWGGGAVGSAEVAR